MHTHFNQHDSSITDAQDALLQERLPGKLGNIRLGDMLLDEQDKDGSPIEAPLGKLQNYIDAPGHQKGDIWIPTLSPDASLGQGIKRIQEYSESNPHLTLAFYGTQKRFCIAYLGPIQRNTKPIDPQTMTQNDLPNLRFFRGGAYIIAEKHEK
jgi:hypothetical protein